MPTGKGLATKKKILECSANLFLTKGYHNTGLNDILKALELPKGCFYYHFHSKKDLAIQVAKYYADEFRSRIQLIAPVQNWSGFAEQFTDIFLESAKSNTCFGCPFAVLGSELAFFDPQIAQAFLAPLKELICLFHTVFLSSGFSQKDAEVLSSKAFALFEGYLMYFRISQDIKALYQLKYQFLELGNENKEKEKI